MCVEDGGSGIIKRVREENKKKKHETAGHTKAISSVIVYARIPARPLCMFAYVCPYAKQTSPLHNANTICRKSSSECKCLFSLLFRRVCVYVCRRVTVFTCESVNSIQPDGN